MVLPPELQAFSRLPVWNTLFFMLAAGIALFAGWSLWRERRRADLYYLLLGLYLVAFQAPAIFPALEPALGISWSWNGDFASRFAAGLPVIGLFILAVRAR